MLGYVGCLFNSNVNQRQLTSKQLNILEVTFPYTSYKPGMIWYRKFEDMACVKVCDVTSERSGFQAVSRQNGVVHSHISQNTGGFENKYVVFGTCLSFKHRIVKFHRY